MKLIQGGESYNVEFKPAYRWDLFQNKRNDELKYQVVKTIAAFLNSEWWKLFVWVSDDSEILWLENDIELFFL